MYLPRKLTLSSPHVATWFGQSGKQYDFAVIRPDGAWPDEPAVYVLAKRVGNATMALYVGQTSSLERRFGRSASSCPEEWERALALGMTHVHLRFEACSERERQAEIRDLLAVLRPPLNEAIIHDSRESNIGEDLLVLEYPYLSEATEVFLQGSESIEPALGASAPTKELRSPVTKGVEEPSDVVDHDRWTAQQEANGSDSVRARGRGAGSRRVLRFGWWWPLSARSLKRASPLGAPEAGSGDVDIVLRDGRSGKIVDLSLSFGRWFGFGKKREVISQDFVAHDTTLDGTVLGDALATETPTPEPAIPAETREVTHEANVLTATDDRPPVSEPVPIAEARQSLAINHGVHGEPTVLFAGELSPASGADILMDAIVTVCSGNSEVRFAFAGNGPLRGELEGRAWQAGLAHRCRFLGDVPADAFERVLAASDFVVIPARTWQDESLAQMATSYGKPVLTTHQAQMHCVVHGENGLIAYDNPGSLVWGIREFLNTPCWLVKSRSAPRQSLDHMAAKAA